MFRYIDIAFPTVVVLFVKLARYIVVIIHCLANTANVTGLKCAYIIPTDKSKSNINFSWI
jgi:hypothetical protein